MSGSNIKKNVEDKVNAAVNPPAVNAEHVVHVIEEKAQKAAHAVEEVAQKITHKAEELAKKTVHAAEEGAKKAAHIAQETAHKAKQCPVSCLNLTQGAKKAAHSVEKGFNRVGTFFHRQVYNRVKSGVVGCVANTEDAAPKLK
jgi:uncharacterized protein YoxC